MSKVNAIAGWPGKNVDSRPVDEVDSEVIVPEFDEGIMDEKPLAISEDNSKIVMDSFNKQQASYVLQSAAKNKVRKAQDAIREHNKGYGRNNPEYTALSNELNTLTQELAAATQTYLLDKASYKNDEKRFGGDVKF